MKLTGEQLKTLAQAIHEDYRKTNPGTPYDKPWNDLPENIQQSNVDQANAFFGYLDYLGLLYGKNDMGGNSVKQLTGEQVETLAARIHDVWEQSKEAAGWVYGEFRDDAKKIHNLLIPYDKLTEAEKDKDRAVARSIVPLLTEAGIAVQSRSTGC